MARGPRKLKITQGTDEANDGVQRYRVDPDGFVTVPADVADRLLSGGGFVDVTDPPEPIPAGMVRIAHPNGSSCSWEGVTYAPDDKGFVTVPAAAVEDMAAHGFSPVGETVEQVVARSGVRIPARTDQGIVILRGQPGQGASFDGVSYTADDDGLMLVPVGAVEALMSHGFIVAPTFVEGVAKGEPEAEAKPAEVAAETEAGDPAAKGEPEAEAKA